MRSFDLTPLYRATIGFDQLAEMFDRIFSSETGGGSYPPFNIEKIGDDHYRISIAVAGFSPDEIEVELRDQQLVIRGAKAQNEEEAGRTFLYRGIAQRAFEKRFQLADYIRVQDAIYENGMLHVDLVREIPEALRPRKIEIKSLSGRKAETGKVIEGEVEKPAETAGAKEAETA